VNDTAYIIRDNAVCRLERLQSLADKLNTDCRTCENHVDNLSRRLAEVHRPLSPSPC